MAIDLSMQAHFSFGAAPVIIRNGVGYIKGGKVLDVSDWSDDFIKAGHIIVTDGDTYKPLSVTDGAYDDIEEGYSYAGVLVAAVSVKEPFGSILYSGEVNDDAVPYAISDAIKEGLPLIAWQHD